MKKVFHFVTNPTVNGLEKLVITICQLVNGFDYTYVVPKGPIEKKLKQDNIKYISVDKMNVLSVRKIINKYKPDVVHGHDVKASLYLACNYKICKNNGIKIISELHNDDQRMHRIGLRSLLYQISCRAYDEIVCVSQDVYDNYIFKNNIKDKSVIIDNVVNPITLDNDSDNISDIDCIFVGRFEYQKNPQKFVKIMEKVKEQIPSLKCLMIGEGSQKINTLNIINNLNLENNISVINYQDNPYKFISKSKILYMPSRFEGFGLVALESMLVGTPVACHKVTGLDKIVNNDVGIITNDNKLLVDEIVKNIKDSDYQKSKSNNSIKRANCLNDVDKFKQKYREIYK